MKSWLMVFAISRCQKESAWKSGSCLTVANPMKRWVDGGLRLRRGWHDVKEGALVILPTLTSFTFSRVIQGERLMTTSACQRPSPEVLTCRTQPITLYDACESAMDLVEKWSSYAIRPRIVVRGGFRSIRLFEKLPRQVHRARLNRCLRIRLTQPPNHIVSIYPVIIVLICICCYFLHTYVWKLYISLIVFLHLFSLVALHKYVHCTLELHKNLCMKALPLRSRIEVWVSRMVSVFVVGWFLIEYCESGFRLLLHVSV